MQINIFVSMRVKLKIDICQSPKFVESIKLINHSLQAKIEYFNKYLQVTL